MRSGTVAGFCLLAVSVTGLWGCESPEEKEARSFAQAVSLYELGDDAKAMVELKNVLQINPKNVEAIYYAGLIQKRTRQIDRAIEAFYQATLERPTFVEAQHELGSLALGRGGVDVAAEAADAILGVDADHPDGLALAAAVALSEGKLDQAAELAQRALEQEAHHEQAVSVIAGLHNRGGQPERGLEVVEAAIEARPDSPLLRITRITLLADMGRLEPLAAAWQDLIELQPDDPVHRLALADVHVRQGAGEQAIAVLREAIDDGVAMEQIAGRLIEVVHAEQGLEAAERELISLIEREGSDDDAGLRFDLARLYASADRPEDARRVLAEIAEDPVELSDRDDALAEMADLDLQGGEVERAGELAAEVLEGDLDHPTANLVRGLIMLARQQPDEAIRYGRAALRRDGGWAPALRLIAQAHLAAGEPELAVPELVKVVAREPGDLRSAELFATLLTRSGDYEVALKVWNHILQVDSASPSALQARARISMREGNWARARADIERLGELPGQAFNSTLLAGELLLERGQPDAGRERLAAAQALAPDAREPLVGLVRSYVSQADLEGALGFLDQRLAERPEDALAWSFKAQVLARMDRSQNAEAALEQAIALAPDEAPHHRQLGRLLLRRDAPHEAIRVLERARTMVGDQVGLLAELAWAYYQAGQPEGAIDTYGRLLELEPGADQAANNFASLIATYRPDDQASIAHALEVASAFRGSDDPIRLDTLGWLYYRKGDFAVAQTFLRRALSATPEAPEYNYHLGMTLMETGDPQAAVQHLEVATRPGADYQGLDEARTTLQKLRDAAGGSVPDARS